MKRHMLRFPRRFFLLVAFGVAAAAAHAQSEVYLCVDQNGVKEYQNTGDTNGCKRVNLSPLTFGSSSKSVAGGGFNLSGRSSGLYFFDEP